MRIVGVLTIIAAAFRAATCAECLAPPNGCCREAVIKALRGDVGEDQLRFVDLVCLGKARVPSRHLCRDAALLSIPLNTRVSFEDLGCHVKVHRLGADGVVALWET